MIRTDLKSMSLEELKKEFLKIGEKPYRGLQLYNYMHKNMNSDVLNINSFSKELRDKLNRDYYISDLKILERFDSKLDGTKKYLFLLEDNNIIEGVAMKYKYGYSACISTQVGCRMGCSFCASTKEGIIRNITPGEMLSEIYNIQRNLGIRLSNIVLMGSGEPLDNYLNVMKMLRILNDKNGQNFSFRNVTISTCGIVHKIYQLADEEIPVTLSVSLHFPFNELRSKIMPINNKYPIEEIIKACKYYVNRTNRRVTFEYTLIEGLNDGRECLDELKRILNGLLCHVNIIPLNPIKEFKYKKPEMDAVKIFVKELNKNGIPATVRRQMGADIDAACGQLRRSYMNEKGLL